MAHRMNAAWFLMAAAGLACMPPARAADEAALDLQPAAEAKPATRQRQVVRLMGELAVGRLSQRYDLGTETARRASVDLTLDFKPANGLRVVFSDRLDDIHPVEAGARSTLNSVREAYVSWQSEDGQTGIDLGRHNLRFGPAYGFNPTDYFREGATRAVTSADPLAQRENRLGTAMLRVQRLWSGGGVSVVLAPKLRDAPSRESFSLDLGATNHADRALLALSVQPSDRMSGQLFVFHERGTGTQLGANGTLLLGNAVVAFAEASRGRDADLLSSALDPNAARVVQRNRASAGLTYTTPSRLAVTAEFEYNGFALDEPQWRRALGTYGLEPMGAYLTEVQRRQDIASRKAMLVYLSQRDAFVKNLELTGLLRWNAGDRSRFAWAEARYHFDRVDVALQWQGNFGKAATEYGASTTRSLVQLLAAVYY
jgi:hypothetical protein